MVCFGFIFLFGDIRHINGGNNLENKKRLNIDDLYDVLSVKEVASFLGVSIKTVNNMIHRNDLKSFKFGNSRLILKQELMSTIGYKQSEQMHNVEIQSDIKDIKPGLKTIIIPKTSERYGYESMCLEA